MARNDYEILWEDKIDGTKWRAISWWDENINIEGEKEKGNEQFQLQVYIPTTIYPPIRHEWIPELGNIPCDIVESLLSELSFWRRTCQLIVENPQIIKEI